ncbi:glycosyltransferase family 87 protein [Mycobacterium gordonae]|uniref:glycosyltransferase family 87 protein n=1 Tax=Mycobacterium gordonae TaxID=1778 RepID=UPI00135638B2|nr:glycosyltransferase family 87 protein [Mycobacterium gordonae]MCV7008517.1 DUF2029 domain-containing protein [Mycobacterium gordonae]
MTNQSERTLLLGTVLVASMLSATVGFVLAHYYSVDVITSLLIFLPSDCFVDLGIDVGRHCFSDYAISVKLGMRANPWEPVLMYLPPDFKLASANYPAAGLAPQVMFGLLGKWLGAPRLGLLGYLTVLTAAVFTPAVWASRGALGLERLVVFGACGVAAIPAWVVIDRGNAVGFMVPIALVFLIALCRERWGLAAVMVVLAALLKPQFAVLVVVLFAARQWRLGGIAVAGVAISNVAAYALWPRDFPGTIIQSVSGIVGYGGSAQSAVVEGSNASFGKALLAIPDRIKASQNGGKIPDDFLAAPRSLIGYVVLVLVVAVVIGLGKRLPPVLAGFTMLAVASLFISLANPYYLVFVLPIAAVVVRDPDGPPGRGIFDRPEMSADRRRAVGVCVSMAVAFSIAQILLPGPSRRVAPPSADSGLLLVDTTMSLTPILWLVTLGVIFTSYARRPALARAGESTDQPGAPQR